MSTTWQDLRDRMLAETDRIWLEEPDELKKLRLGVLENRAGSYDQYFTTWDFANGMIRDFSMYTMYPILKAALSPTFSLEQLRELINVFHPLYTEYLGYSGYATLRDFCREFRDIMEDFNTKEEFVDCYKAFLRYSNKIAAWSYHYFPWELGVAFPQRDPAWVAEVSRLSPK